MMTEGLSIHMIRATDRVELHPATDYWMRGDRFGTVEKVGRKWVSVRLDKTYRLVRLLPINIVALWEAGGH
jgi:hypothetical protein